MPSGENVCLYTNDFDKPEDQRELAHFGLARNRTFKNVFDKRDIYPLDSQAMDGVNPIRRFISQSCRSAPYKPILCSLCFERICQVGRARAARIVELSVSHI